MSRGERFVHHDHARSLHALAFLEGPSIEDVHAHRVEVAGAHDAEVHVDITPVG